MRKALLAIAALAGIVTVASAQRPARTPADLIRNRQDSYKQIQSAFRVLFQQNQAGEPSIEAIRPHAATIARLAPQVNGWFPPGTGPETGVPTRAKAELWANRQDFMGRAAAFVVASRRVDAAARAGDVGAFRAAFPALRQACADCHDRYRGPELPRS
jgi:cytochrome c556